MPDEVTQQKIVSIGVEPELASARPKWAGTPATVSNKWRRAKERGGWTKIIDGAEVFILDLELAEFEKDARAGGKDALRGVRGEERLDRLHFERIKRAAGIETTDVSSLQLTRPDGTIAEAICDSCAETIQNIMVVDDYILCQKCASDPIFRRPHD